MWQNVGHVVVKLNTKNGSLSFRSQPPAQLCKTEKSEYRCHGYPPFQLVIGPWGEGGALDDLAHLLPTEAEVVDGPHVRELHHFDLQMEQILSELLDSLRVTGNSVTESV